MKRIINTGLAATLFGGEFELLDTGFSTGSFNMEFDIGRTEECSAGKALPMFRLYGWEPWAVSLGANQKESEINKDECAKRGFHIVRRPTGGRAVLHANELTYSVVLRLPYNMTVHDIYREIHKILLAGLSFLGCEGLDFEKSQADFKNLYKSSALSVACFVSSARYEISWFGKKVVGSAQRLFGNTLLQHGSILLGSGHEQLAHIVNVKNESERTILRDYILKHSATLEEVCGAQISYKDCAGALVQILKD